MTVVVGVFMALFVHNYQAMASESSERRSGIVLSVNDAIGPATMDYLVRGFEQAAADNAALVVIELDTPGGLVDSMRLINKRILASPVPVATYVSPSGSRAASAGTYILYASHIAAMAPATHLGSATPVQMGGMPGSDEPEPASPSEEDVGDDAAEEAGKTEESSSPRRGGSAMERKMLEDSVAYIRELAERHGRNADWAEEAVREAVNLGSQEALEKNVVDVVARDIDDLLQQIHGRTVAMAGGELTLDTAELEMVRVDPNWRTQLLAVITNPNIAYFLMLIGFYGIIFELSNPGSIFPGVIGVISLVLALFAFQVLSVNYAGLVLIILGLVFIIAEAFAPSFGILGIGGIVAFVVGSVILMDGSHQDISLPTIGGVAAIAAGFMLWALYRLVGLRRSPAASGAEHLLRERALALDDFVAGGDSYLGHVQVSGERWNARAGQPVKAGTWLTIRHLDGLTLEVSPER
ncbi:NfeD family protein [Halopseudomonas salegens]|nr:nodulation protein NfeD [Halopseudomonas salegens]